jgi:hypothetical protein
MNAVYWAKHPGSVQQEERTFLGHHQFPNCLASFFPQYLAHYFVLTPHIPDAQPIRFRAAEKASVAISLGVPMLPRGIGDTK